MNRAMVAVLFATAFLAVATASQAGPANAAARTWDFSTDQLGSPPVGFVFARTGKGNTGRWVVISSTETGATGKVLAQLDADGTDYRFPVAVAQEFAARDFQLSVLCAPISGRVDRACGIVFRYRDENNYYVARANALEDNIRLYRVKDGRREQFGSWSGKVSAGKWQELRADARGDRFEIYWDGKKVIDARDATFPVAGKVGVWTKADSVTYFKTLKVEPLGP